MKTTTFYKLLILLPVLYCGISYAGSFELQANLDSLTYYTSSVPFKDLMFQSDNHGLKKRADNTTCSTIPAYDVNGYPTNVPPDCYFEIVPVLHVSGSTAWNTPPTLTGVLPFKKGAYVFTYTGIGDFIFEGSGVSVVSRSPGRYDLNVSNPGALGIYIKVKNYGNPYPQNFHLVHVDDLTTYQSQPFNQRFITALTPYSILRFMDWGITNLSNPLYFSGNLPNANLTPNNLQLASDSSPVNNFYNNMVAIVKVNGQYPTVMISSYDAVSKVLTFASPLPVSTDGKPIEVLIRDFYNKTWASRTPLSPILQTSKTGVAYEYMIQLANVTKKAPWFNIPTAADDDFVRNLLILIDTKLDKSLKAYLEYSNETWNFVFPQAAYSGAMMRKLGLNNASGTLIPEDVYHSYRATQIFRMASRLRGEPELRNARATSRFVRVLASQAGFPSRTRSMMDWGLTYSALPMSNHAAQEYADVIAIAPYFVRPKGDVTDLTTATQTQLYTLQKKAIDELYGTSLSPGVVRQQATYASQRGIKLVQYEGGTHLLDNTTNSLVILTNLLNFNRSSLMYDLYRYNLAQWSNLQTEFGANAIGNFSQFNAVGSSSKYGFWGALEAVSQPLLSSPKYRALSEFALNP